MSSTQWQAGRGSHGARKPVMVASARFGGGLGWAATAHAGQHKYRIAQWGETAMVSTRSAAVVLLLKSALSMTAKLKGKPAGEPWLGSVVVGGGSAN